VVESLLDKDRSGRPPVISVATKCELVKLACNRPPKASFAAVWTQQALADELRKQTGRRVSRSTVQRVLSSEGLRPHRVRQWLHSPDPQFQ
jgi:transposase